MKEESKKDSWNYIFGNKYRQRIYDLCREKPLSIPQLQKILSLSHHATLYHVSILENAGFVKVTKHFNKQGTPNEVTSVPRFSSEEQSKSKIESTKHFVNDYLYELSKAKDVEIIGKVLRRVESKKDHDNNILEIKAWLENAKSFDKQERISFKLKPFFINIEFGFKSNFEMKYLQDYVNIVQSILGDNLNCLVWYKNNEELAKKLDLLERTFGNTQGPTDGIINLSIYYK